MTDTTPNGSLDRGLAVLLDYALTMVADHLTPEQRVRLRQRTQELGLADHIKLRSSPEVQEALLGERPHTNPDGGLVGEAAVESRPETNDSTIEEEGSAKISAIPTS